MIRLDPVTVWMTDDRALRVANCNNGQGGFRYLSAQKYPSFEQNVPTDLATYGLLNGPSADFGWPIPASRPTALHPEDHPGGSAMSLIPLPGSTPYPPVSHSVEVLLCLDLARNKIADHGSARDQRKL